MALNKISCLALTLVLTKTIICRSFLSLQASGLLYERSNETESSDHLYDRSNVSERSLKSSPKSDIVNMESWIKNKEHPLQQYDSFSENNESVDVKVGLHETRESRDEISKAQDGLAIIASSNDVFNNTYGFSDGTFQVAENSTEKNEIIFYIHTYMISNKYSTVYLWNKSRVSARDYQQSFCPFRCKDGEKVFINNIDTLCPVIFCTDCQCTRPYCSLYGACCPDISEPYFPPPQLISGLFTFDEYYSANNTLIDEPTDIPGYENTNYTISDVSTANNTSVVLGCDDTSTTYSFFYIRSCSVDFSGDAETVRLCEQDISLDDMTFEVITRVADIVTSAIYRNKFCALCNSLNQTVDFLVKIKCQNYMKVYKATTQNELLRLVLKSDSGCTVQQYTPEMVRYVPCDAALFKSDVIDNCPASSYWQYDKDVDRACSTLTDPKYGVYTNMWSPYYKNIFCAICNLNSFPKYGNCEDRNAWMDSPATRAYLPFSLLINFRRSTSDDNVGQQPKRLYTRVNCSKNQWPTPNGPCVQLLCSDGKLIDKDGCSTALRSIGGLGYNLRVWLVPQLRESDLLTELLRYLPLDLIFQNIKTKLKEMFDDLTDGYLTEIGLISNDFSNSSQSYNLTAPFIVWIQSSLIGKFLTPRDDFEKTLIRTFIDTPISIDALKGYFVTFKQYVMIGQLESSSFCNQTSQDDRNCISETISSDNLFEKKQKFMMAMKNLFLNVTHVLTCRFVSFNIIQFKIDVNYSDIPYRVRVTMDLNGTVVNISDATDLKLTNVDGEGRLTVCHELLDEQLNELEEANKRTLYGQREEASPSAEAQYILTMTCLGISMMCLVLTLFTYLRFRVLQSSAGLNNIFLCTSLLLAQAMLCLASHLLGPSHLCTAVGMLTHFSWLWMFTWTFICCFHMFRVFTAKTRCSSSKSHVHIAEMSRKFFSSLVFPVLVVTTVVVSSVMTSPDRNSGYGDVSCYLNSTLLIGLSVVAPLAVILVCNTVFFTVSVVHIERVRKLKPSDAVKKEDNQNLYVYLKLSSMTGAFWVMAIMAEALGSDAFRFISIFLNGLQGAFIFLSYVCNKRVFHLFLARLRRDTTSSRRSTQLSHTETTSVDSPQSFKGAAEKVLESKHGVPLSTQSVIRTQ